MLETAHRIARRTFTAIERDPAHDGPTRDAGRWASWRRGHTLLGRLPSSTSVRSHPCSEVQPRRRSTERSTCWRLCSETWHGGALTHGGCMVGWPRFWSSRPCSTWDRGADRPLRRAAGCRRDGSRR